MAFNLFRMSIISLPVIFYKKGNIFFAVSTFGSLGPGSAVGEKGKKKKQGQILKSMVPGYVRGPHRLFRDLLTFANIC